MKQTFTVYSDPGHGWARVDFATLSAIGMTPGHFSGCSYVRGGWIYLEEDCDLSLFIKAYLAWTGKEPRFIETHGNRASRIRGYERNTPGPQYRDPSKQRILQTAIDTGRLVIIQS